MFEIDETGPWARLPLELVSKIVMYARPVPSTHRIVKEFYDDVYGELLHLAVAHPVSETEGYEPLAVERVTFDDIVYEAWTEAMDTPDARVRIARDHWFWHDLYQFYGAPGIFREFVDDDGDFDGVDAHRYFTGGRKLLEAPEAPGPVEGVVDWGAIVWIPPEVLAAAVAVVTHNL